MRNVRLTAVLGVSLSLLCIALYWGWLISWLRDGLLSRRNIPEWWLYSEIALVHLLHGKQFSAECWHECFKIECLPDETDSFNFHSDHVKDGYRKCAITPKGERVLIGSTTQLTVKGMAHYLEQVYACGASLGVQFGARAE